MAARTASQTFFASSGRFIYEEWTYTGTYVAGTDTLNAIYPNKAKIVLSIIGNFDSYTVASGVYTFTFSATVSKPWVRFTGYGR